MIVRAYAKVNCALDIVGVFENGYHDLDMIMAPISLYDEIEISESEKDEVICLNEGIPKRNTVSSMVALLKKTFSIDSHYRIVIHKNIPQMSGMAGGSADGAAVLKAILEMEKISISLEEKINLAKQIGADVPFCVVNQWSRVKGIGEKITVLDTDWKIPCLIVKPDCGISTPVAFKNWHESRPIQVDVDTICESVVHKDYDAFIRSINNTLEPVARKMEPILNTIEEEMMNLGMDRVMMSGSGSSMMGFSMNMDIMNHAKKEMEKKYNFVKIVTIGG